MKSLQEYIDTFKQVASKLNLQGDSVEILVQMLANASYISEVENISYAQESSLERATLINSKIQLCMDNMYSVFRGACPRVIINLQPTKFITFEMFDKIISGNDYDIYYLGYSTSSTQNIVTPGSKTLATIEGFTYSTFTANPSTTETDTYSIIGLLCKKMGGRKDVEWTLNANNTYYVDCLENNLSNDIYVKIEDNYYEVTRDFSDHILNSYIYDLTLPSFGSRLFINEIFRESTGTVTRSGDSTATPNTKINATYFVYSSISDYNSSDLKKMSIKGTKIVPFSNDFLNSRGFEEFIPGVILVDSTARDSLGTIHYKSSRDRYVNSIIRSNSDIGIVLEETFPDKIRSGGTNPIFEGDTLIIYYVPINRNVPLTTNEIREFQESRKSYYITDNIELYAGNQLTAVFTIDVEIYQNKSIDSEVETILKNYEGKFNINFNSSLEEIRSQISKIDNVKQLLGLSIVYMDSTGKTFTSSDDINSILDNIGNTYFKVEYIINSVIK